MSLNLLIDDDYAGQYSTAAGAELFADWVLSHDDESWLATLVRSGFGQGPQDIAVIVAKLLKDHPPKNDSVLLIAKNLMKVLKKSRRKKAVVHIVDD
jgi:hypothetical protein